jgi:hypothetical protein
MDSIACLPGKRNDHTAERTIPGLPISANIAGSIIHPKAKSYGYAHNRAAQNICLVNEQAAQALLDFLMQG